MINKNMEKALSKLIKLFNYHADSDPTASYVKQMKRDNLLHDLSTQIANVIASGLSKEQLRNRILELGLKAELFEEVYNWTWLRHLR